MDAKNKKPRVFVITPFTDEHLELYNALKDEFKDLYEFVNAGDTGNVQNILKDIIQPIYDADIILADLTGLNSNVMYELGIAHTMNKKTIMITQDNIDSLPFDQKQYRTQHYATHFTGFKSLRAFLTSGFENAIKNTAVFSNPVQDFLSTIPKSNESYETNDFEEESDDKGFIDYLADASQASECLGKELQELNTAMNSMSDGVKECTQKVSTQKNAVLIKAEVQKAAKYITDFGKEQNIHNRNIRSEWRSIENSTFGLLENKYSKLDSNRIALIEYLYQLYILKESIVQVQNGSSALKLSLNDGLGLQKTLNMAIRTTTPNIDEYIKVTDEMRNSISKILDRSKLVVGDIDWCQMKMESTNE